MKKELQNAAPSSMLSFNIPIHFRQAGQVVGRLLIQEVVQPVGKQQVGVRPPGVDGRLGGVIMREVVARHLNGQPLVKIPPVLITQGVPVIFRMAGDKNPPAVLVAYQIDPRLRRGGQDIQFRAVGHILFKDFRVAGVGRQEPVVEPPHQWMLRDKIVMLKNAEHLAA